MESEGTMSIWQWDFILALFLLVLLNVFSMMNSRNPIDRSRITEAVTLATSARLDMQEYYSYHGQWPTQPLKKLTDSTKLIAGSKMVSGSMVIQFNNTQPAYAEKTLSFTAALSTKGDSVIWLCGSHAAPEGFVPQGPTITSLNRLTRPPECK